LAPGGRLRHVLHAQIFDYDNRVVFANGRTRLGQKVATDVAYLVIARVNPILCFVPVLAEFDPPPHPPLIALQAHLLPLQCLAWLDNFAIRESGEANDTEIHSNHGPRRMNRFLNLSLGLNRDKPFAAVSGDCDVAGMAFHLAAISVANPSQSRKKDSAVLLVHFELFWIRVAEALPRLALFLELRWADSLIWSDLAALPLLQAVEMP
jgi:hypothetical protein